MCARSVLLLLCLLAVRSRMYLRLLCLHLQFEIMCGTSSSTARAGEVRRPRCTPAYAAPEVVLAVDDCHAIAASPAVDMWAFGVIAFEAIARAPALSAISAILRCARGRAAYPWEAPPAQQPRAWRHSRLRALLLPCLAREPAARPNAAAVLASVARIGRATTMSNWES